MDPATPTGAPDPKDVLLSDTDHTKDTAQRVSAGALVAQENAALEQERFGAPKPAAKNADELRALSGVENHEHTGIAPLETYQSDIQRYLKEKDASGISILASEEHSSRKANPNRTTLEETRKDAAASALPKNIFFIGAGILLLLVAIAGAGYAIVLRAPLHTPVITTTPLITVDGSIEAHMDADRYALTTGLASDIEKVQLARGLIANVSLTQGTSTVSSQQFLAVLAPTIPESLARSFDPTFLLGTYAGEAHEPFILFHTDAYEQTYAGMLLWEGTMAQDLLPLFPQTHGVFVDRIIENHDSRAIIQLNGSPALFWTFLDRNTVMIGISPEALQEVASRRAKLGQ